MIVVARDRLFFRGRAADLQAWLRGQAALFAGPTGGDAARGNGPSLRAATEAWISSRFPI